MMMGLYCAESFPVFDRPDLLCTREADHTGPHATTIGKEIYYGPERDGQRTPSDYGADCLSEVHTDPKDPTRQYQDFVETIEIETPPFKCKTCGRMSTEHPSIDVRNATSIIICQERAMKWQRVEPGTVIPAGQPYRVEWSHNTDGGLKNGEYLSTWEIHPGDNGEWFVDSTWKPPLVLPTEPTWGFVVHLDATDRTVNSEHIVAQWWLSDTEQILRRDPLTGVPVHRVLDFIPLTDEQIARIEAAR